MNKLKCLMGIFILKGALKVLTEPNGIRGDAYEDKCFPVLCYSFSHSLPFHFIQKFKKKHKNINIPDIKYHHILAKVCKGNPQWFNTHGEWKLAQRITNIHNKDQTKQVNIQEGKQREGETNHQRLFFLKILFVCLFLQSMSGVGVGGGRKEKERENLQQTVC